MEACILQALSFNFGLNVVRYCIGKIALSYRKKESELCWLIDSTSLVATLSHATTRAFLSYPRTVQAPALEAPPAPDLICMLALPRHYPTTALQIIHLYHK